MALNHGLPGERSLWRNMLKVIRPLIEKALVDADIEGGDNIQWTEMRWDIPDITASWPKDRPTRNIHGWIRGGSWPRFFLEFEGAIWEDDEEKLQRRLRFFSFPGRPGVLTLSGLASVPVVAIENGAELQSGLDMLARDLSNAKLDNEVSTHPLQPEHRGRGGTP